jgi:hypothetical protein
MKRIVYILLILLVNQTGFGQCVTETVDVIISHYEQVPGDDVHVYGEALPLDGFEGAWNYSVDFGNGTVVTGTGSGNFFFSETTTYLSTGTFTITATLTDVYNSCSTTINKTISIFSNPESMVAPELIVLYGDINSESYPFSCPNSPSHFSVNLDLSGGDYLHHVLWDMGDGTIISTASATFDYTHELPGIYVVTAKVFVMTGSGLCARYAEGTSYIGDAYRPTASKRIINIEIVPSFSISPFPVSPSDDVTFTFEGYTLEPEVFFGYPINWQYSFKLSGTTLAYGDLEDLEVEDVLHYSVISEGAYTAELNVYYGQHCPYKTTKFFTATETPCDTCNSFKLDPTKRYWMSAWVMVNEPDQVKSYNPNNYENSVDLDGLLLDDPYIELEFFGPDNTVQLFPSGNIIDGWQRIVGEFTVPLGTNDLGVNLYADNTFSTYFDDIRIHPFNGSMKSYVYDGETFWLVAELDDNNYATFYEYDNEGGLVRIKKETARGIVTIQETRSGTIKE